MLGIVVVSEAVVLGTEIAALRRVGDINADPTLAVGYHSLRVLVGLSGAAAFALAGLVFVAWLHRSIETVPDDRRRFRHGPGWAIGAWFVPFLNLVRPKQMVDDLWASTRPSTREPGDAPDWVHWWWGLYLATSVGDALVGVEAAIAPERLRGLLVADAFLNLLSIVGALLAVRLVVRITARHALVRGERPFRPQPIVGVGVAGLAIGLAAVLVSAPGVTLAVGRALAPTGGSTPGGLVTAGTCINDGDLWGDGRLTETVDCAGPHQLEVVATFRPTAVGIRVDPSDPFASDDLFDHCVDLVIRRVDPGWLDARPLDVYAYASDQQDFADGRGEVACAIYRTDAVDLIEPAAGP